MLHACYILEFAESLHKSVEYFAIAIYMPNVGVYLYKNDMPIMGVNLYASLGSIMLQAIYNSSCDTCTIECHIGSVVT